MLWDCVPDESLAPGEAALAADDDAELLEGILAFLEGLQDQ